MYRFSRSIYRDLAPYVTADRVKTGSSHVVVTTNGNGNGRAVNGHANGNGNGHAAANGHANANGSNAVLGSHTAGGPGPGHQVGPTNRQKVLGACEATMRRLAYDRRYFAHPARSLFGEVRMYFPIGEQDRVRRVIDRNVRLALEHLERLPEAGLALDGQPSECHAHTRKGTPCQRQPLPGRDYCPSHKHLEESLEPADRINRIEVLDERFGDAQDSLSTAV